VILTQILGGGRPARSPLIPVKTGADDAKNCHLWGYGRAGLHYACHAEMSGKLDGRKRGGTDKSNDSVTSQTYLKKIFPTFGGGFRGVREPPLQWPAGMGAEI
jgi:hypothetical protein